jgi:hypothetical protein
MRILEPAPGQANYSRRAGCNAPHAFIVPVADPYFYLQQSGRGGPVIRTVGQMKALLQNLGLKADYRAGV